MLRTSFNRSFIAVATASLFSLTANAQSGSGADSMMSTTKAAEMSAATTTSVSPSDKLFFTKAAVGGMTEVAAGKLAVDQGSSADVKTFGQRMVDDHSKAGDELKSLAQKKGVTLPDAPDAKHQAMLDSLKAKKGKAFDTAFIADMKKGHAEAIAAFTVASKSKDSDIAQFASTTLPTLKDHQKTIPGGTAMAGGAMKMGDDTPKAP